MSFRSFIIIICCLTGGALHSQAQDITGLWKGTLYNDTTQRYLRYEIAISEKKGKLSGYTHIFYIVDDREYYGIKKVKIRKVDDKIVLQTDEMIANNFPATAPKGIRQVDVLTLEMQDSVLLLTGPFHTIRTKEYHSLTGSIRVQRKNDFHQSALVPHLEELGLANELSFITADVSTPAVVTVAPVEIKPVVEKPVIVKAEKAVKVKTEKAVVAKVEKPVKEIVPVKTAPVVKGPAADVATRKIETIRSVYYKSDSLVLTLYDNGEVDGDTVSVLLNGTVIMPMQGLSTRAIRKTIHITKDMPDSIQLLMYAENLGSIPPNTGLLVVHDGEDIYEIRFSGDYQKSAAIVFRRKN